MQERNPGYSHYTVCIQNCPFEGEVPPTVLLIFLAWFSNLLFQWDPPNLRVFHHLFLAASKLLACDIYIKPFPLWSYSLCCRIPPAHHLKRACLVEHSQP